MHSSHPKVELILDAQYDQSKSFVDILENKEISCKLISRKNIGVIPSFDIIKKSIKNNMISRKKSLKLFYFVQEQYAII